MTGQAAFSTMHRAGLSDGSSGRWAIRGEIVRHAKIAEGMHRLRVHAPPIAAAARPGQFAMVRIPDRFDPLLARPLAIYDTAVGSEGGPPVPDGSDSAQYVDFIYAVHGKFTTAASSLVAGDSVEIWGPLGNGFGIEPEDHLLLVAGGIGQTALLALGKERLGVARYGTDAVRSGSSPKRPRVTLLWGCRTESLFGDVEDFARAGIGVRLATLDGSVGQAGTVVDLLDDFEPLQAPPGGSSGGNLRVDVRVACCGPEGMMAAVSRWCAERRMPCLVSMETPMACGVGICFSCVARVRDESGGWDYRRTCIEGPVFDGTVIDW